MKKLLISLALSLFFVVPAHAWWIDSYDTDIEVQESGSVIITETITANFSDDPHHGIYRLIPKEIAKEDYTVEKLRMNLISITDEAGNPINYSKGSSYNATSLQIGDADTLVQSAKTYVIKYEILNALGYFDDHTEIYWNAVGSEWETEIKQASSTVTLPDGISSTSDINTICYTGSTGSDNCTSRVIDTNTVAFAITKPLNWYEAFTITVGFPNDLAAKPDRTLWLIQDFWPIIMIPIVFALLFNRWKKYGKDKKVHTVVPEYQPPKNLTPIESGILIDEKADMRDISAVMIDLAIRGFIRIEEIEEKTLGIFKNKDYILHRLKESDEKSLAKFEQTLLKKLFETKKEVKLSKLKNKFYKFIPELKKQMFQAVLDKKLFTKNPEKVKGGYLAVGIVGIIAGLTITGALSMAYTAGLALGISITICGILTMVFGFYMPKKTTVGHELYQKILGLKMYIETAEKDRIKFHEKRQHFERLLPYAMIFNQTKHWSKQFEDIYKEPPDWYSSGTWGAASAFSLNDFTHNLENCTSAMSTTLSSAPGGGGSGFSGGAGGGGGGGGGGAW